jgi:hypothetical protein
MSAFDSVSLVEYVELLAKVPLPTQQQKDNFVEYVSHARSWYKGSPYPPGIVVHVFLDWYAGGERKRGTPVVTDRTEGEVLTSTYRTAFGYLAFSCGSKNVVPLVVSLVNRGAVVRPSDKSTVVRGDNALVYGLPEEIFQAGEAKLTGAVHTLSAANLWVWDDDRGPDRIDWPQDSGGQGTLEKIFNRCREIRESAARREYTESDRRPPKGYPSSDGHVWLADKILYELLAPERQRQRTEMMRAIDRVCEIIENQKRRLTEMGL